MTEPSERGERATHPRTRRRIPRRWFAITAALLLAAGVALWARREYVQRSIESELAKIRAAGEPVTLAELQAYHDNAPNAIPLVTQRLHDAFAVSRTTQFIAAAKGVPYLGRADTDATAVGQPWPDRAVSEQFLATYGGMLDKLHKCVDIDGTMLLDQNFTPGAFTSLDDVHSMRQCARLLQLDAAVQAHQGDVRRATLAIRSLFRLAAAVADDPTLSTFFTRQAIDGCAIGHIKSLISAVDFSDDDLAILDADLRKIDYHAAFPRVMAGERAFYMQGIENPDPPSRPDWLVGRANITLEYLQIVNDQARIVRLPFPQALREIRDHDRRLDRVRTWMAIPGLARAIALSLVPQTGLMIESVACSDVRVKACRAQIAIERYFRKHGALPARLDDLVPEFLDAPLIDPFDGGTLRCAIDAQEIRIYSVGENGVDDGGMAGLPRPVPDDADYVIRFKRPLVRP